MSQIKSVLLATLCVLLALSTADDGHMFLTFCWGFCAAMWTLDAIGENVKRRSRS